MKVTKEKHSLLTRWSHWVNFPLLPIMIRDGLPTYWENDVYTITIAGHRIIRRLRKLKWLLHAP